MELICEIQKYHWGRRGKSSLVGKFASANSGIDLDEEQSYAEFWMGTHPNGPSRLKDSKMELSHYLNLHPNDLGACVINHFCSQLPFLFKILSVEEPLSIQAHPTKSHAEKLFQKFPTIYKDGNHKPELAIAVSRFEALCGFRPQCEIKHFLRNIPEFRILIESDKIESFLKISKEKVNDSRKLMKDCFQSFMLCEENVIASAIDKLITRLENSPSTEKEEYLFALVKRISSFFPKDVGVFCIYWFNYLALSPGEALYLAPDEPHAYLYGDCIECMANSDNVVRAGLTPKFRDVPTLCQMLTYKNYHPSEILFQPTKDDKYCELFSPPVKDFAVAKISLPKNCQYTLKKRKSASILLVIEGQGESDSAYLDFGKVLFIPSMTDLLIKSDGLVIFQAFCNM